MFGDHDRSLHTDGNPAVVVVVGVNGSGKTTTIAKLGAHLERGGTSVLVGAGDPFRAGATEARDGDRHGHSSFFPRDWMKAMR